MQIIKLFGYFNLFDCERTRWRLFPENVEYTKLPFYSNINYIILLLNLNNIKLFGFSICRLDEGYSMNRSCALNCIFILIIIT
jgi:hypothetical protein